MFTMVPLVGNTAIKLLNETAPLEKKMQKEINRNTHKKIQNKDSAFYKRGTRRKGNEIDVEGKSNLEPKKPPRNQIETENPIHMQGPV